MPFPLGTGIFPSLESIIKLLKTITSSSDELNILDGATLSTVELNKLDGVAGAVVGTTDALTLTNKIIDGASNTISGTTEAVDWQAVDLVLGGLTNTEVDVDATKIITEINKGIIRYLKDNGYKSINDIKGLAHQFKTQEVPDFD